MEVNSRGGVAIFFLRFFNFRGGVCIEATDCGRGGVSEIFPSRGGVLEALPPLCPCMVMVVVCVDIDASLSHIGFFDKL